MYKFKTQSGSIYEVDPEGYRIRRFSGPNSGPSVRAREEWREYLRITLEVGRPGEVVWTDSTPPLVEGTTPVLKMTWTSPVVKIEQRKENDNDSD